jgi:protein TonB
MQTNNYSEEATAQERLRGFLLGLVVGLALLLTGLEYTSHPVETEDNDELLDEMDQDLEMMPPIDRNDMIAAVQAPASKSVTENVKAVNHETNATDKISPVTSPLVIGSGEGETKTSNVTEAIPQVPVEEDTTLLRTVEKLPEFPGGIVQFMKWITRNLHYPNVARQQRIQGKVVVSFIVNKDGSIAQPKIEKSVDPNLDQEALRVVKMMPRWKPGLMNEQPCRTMVVIPINFVL